MGSKHRKARIAIMMITIATLLPLNSYAFDPSTVIVTVFSEDVERKLFGLSGLSDYVDPVTPAFDASADESYFTGIDARSSFVSQVCGSNPYFTKYYLDPVVRNYPVVFITRTDLSGCKDMKAAADALKKSGRTNVMIQAGIHGNEPAGAEGALYFLQRFSSDPNLEAYLSNLNIVIIPCANVNTTRAGSSCEDPNRDSLYVAEPYTEKSHALYNHLMPEVFIDCHELTNKENELDHFSDIRISGAGTSNIAPKIIDISAKMAASARSNAVDCGLRATAYSSSGNNTMARVYYALYGSCSVVMETPGINMGKSHFARRVFAHYEGLMGILRFSASNSKVIKTAVRNTRNAIVARGKQYKVSNVFALRTVREASGETVTRDLYDAATAEAVDTETINVCTRTKTIRSRTLPTAYIISKKDPGAKKAVSILKKNGIKYYSVKAGRKINCAKYKGTVAKATVTNRKNYVFSKGAFVIPMDQPGGMVIAAMLEPDVKDTEGFNGSLVQSGVIKITSIFRYRNKGSGTVSRP